MKVEIVESKLKFLIKIFLVNLELKLLRNILVRTKSKKMICCKSMHFNEESIL